MIVEDVAVARKRWLGSRNMRAHVHGGFRFEGDDSRRQMPAAGYLSR